MINMLADDSRVKKMDRSTVRMMRMDSPEFKEANMSIFMGTPEECWYVMHKLTRQAMIFSGINPDTVKLRRDIAKLFRIDENGDRVEIVR